MIAENLDFTNDRELKIEYIRAEIECLIDSGLINERGIDMLESFYIQLDSGKILSKKQIECINNMEYWYEKRFPKMKEGYLYLMWDIKHDEYKVGFSKDPWKRRKSFQTAGRDMSIVYTIKSPNIAEKYLHKFLYSHNINGEWYKGGSWVGNFIEMANRSIEMALENIKNFEKKTEGVK